MEDIPNKIRNSLGIICDVQLHAENRKKYISVALAKSKSDVFARSLHFK